MWGLIVSVPDHCLSSYFCKLCEDMVSTKAFVHFIKQPSSSLEQIKTFVIHGVA